MKVICPHCKGIHECPDEYVGRQAKCLICSNKIQIPTLTIQQNAAEKNCSPPPAAPLSQKTDEADNTYKVTGQLSVVFGILSLIICGPFFAVPAILLGAIAAAKGRQSGLIGILLGFFAIGFFFFMLFVLSQQ